MGAQGRERGYLLELSSLGAARQEVSVNNTKHGAWWLRIPFCSLMPYDFRQVAQNYSSSVKWDNKKVPVNN